ncbi:MAG: hypothetical protein AB1649_17980 [Chloroflexota bacterium]
METQMSARPSWIALASPREMKVHVIQTIALLVFATVVCVLLLPEAIHRAAVSRLFTGAREFFMGVAGIFTLLLLFLGPLALCINAILRYREARALDRLGVITKGLILEKWVDTVDDQPSYRVSYQFKDHLRAWQVVPASLYHSLHVGQTVEVLHLSQSPHISRLEWEEEF